MCLWIRVVCWVKKFAVDLSSGLEIHTFRIATFFFDIVFGQRRVFQGADRIVCFSAWYLFVVAAVFKTDNIVEQWFFGNVITLFVADFMRIQKFEFLKTKYHIFTFGGKNLSQTFARVAECKNRTGILNSRIRPLMRRLAEWDKPDYPASLSRSSLERKLWLCRGTRGCP